MAYLIERPSRGGLGAVSVADTVREQVERVLNPQVEKIQKEIRLQVDRGVDAALDRAGDTASEYLDSKKGQRLSQKLEKRLDTAITNVAYRNRWNLALAGTSFAALTVVGVALGSRAGPRGVKWASAVALVTALPLLFSGGGVSGK